MKEYITRLPLFFGLLALALLAALVLWIEDVAARLYWQKWTKLNVRKM